ncbi:MAG TPA: hypothetical protein VK548_10525, partial [Candidatus Acidoferrum sp.]|nr:hypothetical protein [Candidatus Acidoferrum sp.]
ERAVRQLAASGFRSDRITLLTPRASEAEIHSVPTTEAEPPGIGRAIGAVAGAAAGAGGGMQAGALVSLIVPGVGPVLALGALGALLLGIGGAAMGAAVDRNSREGLPRDELYVYEDALRRGKTVVIALPETEAEAERARSLFAAAGAESIDAAREQWWLGLRDAEQAEYTKAGGDFVRDEAIYRRGFEAACGLGRDGRTYAEVVGELRTRCPEVYQHESFRQGFARGRTYVRSRDESRQRAA